MYRKTVEACSAEICKCSEHIIRLSVCLKPDDRDPDVKI